MDRIRFVNGTSMSLRKAEKAILDEGQLVQYALVSADGRHCGVGVLENWTYDSATGMAACSRKITRKTRFRLSTVNDKFRGTTELECEDRALHVAAWLRSQAKR